MRHTPLGLVAPLVGLRLFSLVVGQAHASGVVLEACRGTPLSCSLQCWIFILAVAGFSQGMLQQQIAIQKERALWATRYGSLPLATVKGLLEWTAPVTGSDLVCR